MAYGCVAFLVKRATEMGTNEKIPTAVELERNET